MVEESADIKNERTETTQAKEEQAAKPKRRAPAKRSAKKGTRVVLVKSRRKSAVARASIKEGRGAIRVNSRLISTIKPDEVRALMLEPLHTSEMAMSIASRTDIMINVTGGGTIARAEAVRGAIAKALAEFSGNDSLRKEYLKYDRSMIIDDPRRVEPKKFEGPKARARFQTSYR